MSKARDLLPQIRKASTNTEAIDVLHKVLEALHLTNSYTDLVKLKDGLQEEKDRFNSITDGYNKSEKSLEDMLNTRTALNFCYRDIVDAFSFEIYKHKSFWEESKSSVRSESIKRLREDEEVQKIFTSKSTSAIRDIVGLDSGYKSYISNASISYGLYQELNTLLNSIRMFIDLLASSIKHEHIILQKDVK